MFDGVPDFSDTEVVPVYYLVGPTWTYYVSTVKEILMAATSGVRDVSLSTNDRNQIGRAIEYLITSIERAIKNEVVEEIASIRRKEVLALQDLRFRVTSGG